MRALVSVVFGVVLALSCAAQVRVAVGAPGSFARTVEDELRRALPDVPLVLESPGDGPLWGDAVAGRPFAADILVAVDAQVLETASVAGLLVAVPGGGEVPGLTPFRTTAHYVVPWLDPWVVAFDVRALSEQRVPRSLDELAAPDRALVLALPDGPSAPSLWVQWLQLGLLDGEGVDAVLARMLVLDARVPEYFLTPRDAAFAVARSPELPCGVVRSSDLALVERDAGFVRWRSFRRGTPATGLGVAIAADSDAARRVRAALLAPDVVWRVARAHAVLPGLPRPPAGEELPEHLTQLLQDAVPCLPEPELAPAWLARWASEVRGEGARSETTRSVLDAVLVVGFLLLAWVVYKQLMRSDG